MSTPETRAHGIPWNNNADTLADVMWARFVNRKDVYGSYFLKDGAYSQYTDTGLTIENVREHYRNNRIIGIHSTSPDSRCRWFAIDIDAHDGDGADPERNLKYALHLARKLQGMGLTAFVLESNGKGGYHVWCLLGSPVASEAVFQFVQRLVADHAEHGLAKAPETFPKQAAVTIDQPCGNWLRLPGRHHKRDFWPRLKMFGLKIESRWLEGEAAVRALVKLKPNPPAKILEGYVKSEPAEAGHWNAYMPPARGRGRKGYDKATAEVVADALAYLPSGMADEHEPWLYVGMALHSWDSQAGYPLWLRFSQSCPARFDDADCVKRWASFTENGGIGIGYVFKRAIDHGWPPPWKEAGKPRTGNSRREHEAAETDASTEAAGEGPDVDGSEKYPTASAGSAGIYIDTGKRIVLQTEGQKGKAVNHLIANFSARISHEIDRHEAGKVRKQFRVAARSCLDREKTVDVAATDYRGMKWVHEQLGSDFMILAGRSYAEHASVAIQSFSQMDGIRKETVYTSTGWIKHEGQSIYLHSGGAIGAGDERDFGVDLSPALAGYKLPPPPDLDRTRKAIKAHLSLWNLSDPKRPGSRAATAVVACLPFRAVIGPSNFVVHFSGSTGTRKTTVARLALAHFMLGIRGRDDAMPVTWRATPNSLQRFAYDAKDSLLVVDEMTGFAAIETATEFVQCQGNLKAKDRMQRDLTAAPSLDPRCSVLSTGEADPARQSALGRMLTIRFVPETVGLNALTGCQRNASEGLMAEAMAAYLEWLAPQLDSIRASHPRIVESIADTIMADLADLAVHPRHPRIVAEILAGYRHFLAFAIEVGAVDEPTAESLMGDAVSALKEVLKDQAEDQTEASDGHKFVRLVAAALSAGKCYLADARTNGCPFDYAVACGWREELKWEGEIGGGQQNHWVKPANSDLIGYIDLKEGYVYLNPDTSKKVAAEAGRKAGCPVENISKVGRELAKDGLCEEFKEGGKTRYDIKKQFHKSGKQRYFKLKIGGLFGFMAGDEESDEAGEVPTVPTDEVLMGTAI
jgi:hypothetical protein